MSAFHCSCGFAIDDADEFGDHFRAVFDREDDTGTDGKVHIEVTPEGQRTSLVCSCGFESGGPEFDDHLLLVRIPADNRGNDTETHVPVDTSTPVRLYFRDDSDGDGGNAAGGPP